MVYSSKDFNFIDFCHDLAKYASIMALAAPKVEEPIYLPLHYSHPLLRDSKSMEKDQLISMIHILVKREDEPTNEASAEPNSFELCIARRRKNIIQRAQENQELKDMVRDLRETRNSLIKPAHPIYERWPVQYRPLGSAALLAKNMLPMTIGSKKQ